MEAVQSWPQAFAVVGIAFAIVALAYVWFRSM